MPRDFFADPGDPKTFERCKLDLGERERHAGAYALHCDLLRLRREDPVFASQRSDRLHGAVLAAEAFVLRYFGEAGDDRLLLVNLGRDLQFVPAVGTALGTVAGTRLAAAVVERRPTLWRLRHSAVERNRMVFAGPCHARFSAANARR